MQASARLAAAAASRRAIAGVSGTIARPCYRSSRCKAHAAPLSAQEPPPKGPKRLSKQERRVRIEEFVEKYKLSNEGRFPTITTVRQHVGGSHYTIREIIQELEYNQTKLPLDVAKSAQVKGKNEFPEHSRSTDDKGVNSHACETFESNKDVDGILISQEGVTISNEIMEKTETCSLVGSSHQSAETEPTKKDLYTAETSKNSDGTTLSGVTGNESIDVLKNKPSISFGVETKSDAGNQQWKQEANRLDLNNTEQSMNSSETTVSDQSAGDKVIQTSILDSDRENNPKHEHEQSNEEEPKQTGLLGSLKSLAFGIRSFWRKL
ncbi:hypothetical protein ACP4OV_000546 [Aristida adscensionis]